MLIQHIKLICAKFKRLILFVFITLLTCVIALLLVKYSSIAEKLYSSPTLAGVVGTLLGAIVGGIFTLFGSISVSKYQQKAQTYIRRKNIIYKPIYDELMKNHYQILQKAPFPITIVVGKRYSGYNDIPQYSAWTRIKNDSRWLEVPKKLSNSLECLELTIQSYQDALPQALQAVTDNLNSVLNDVANTKCTIKNIGEVLLDKVLTNEANYDLFEELRFAIESNEEFNCEQKQKIRILFERRCKADTNIIYLQKRYNQWINKEQQTIELLKLLIGQVNAKYEE